MKQVNRISSRNKKGRAPSSPAASLNRDIKSDTSPIILPVSTYRLQFNRDLNFKKARLIVGYLNQLGLTDVYASPIFKARRGSGHGYDVTDHTLLNDELGTEKDFGIFAQDLKKKKMGLILDVVPNHMCITDHSNKWWLDLLENGPSSPYARFFDIDWHPLKSFLANKVLLPFLGDQYGKVLENQEIQIFYREGAFFARYYHLVLPIAPRTGVQILEVVFESLKSKLKSSDPILNELRGINSRFHHLPLRTETDPARIKERYEKKDLLKNQLHALFLKQKPVQKAMEKALQEINGIKGNPRSFDKLEQLLEDQAYRLSFWQVAADEINYRRFFDINELAAIRVEEPEVFEAVHRQVLDLIRKNIVTGIRIDHVDGLFDPKKYLEDLQEGCQASLNSNPGRPFYVVVEKILGESERLRSEWPIQGTTGYEYLNLLNGLFVYPAHKSAFLKIYRRFTGVQGPFYNLLCTCKEMITHVSNASEVFVLASQLERISEQHRYSRDFTFEGLRYGLREIIACFPVYRSYIQNGDQNVEEEDRNLIRAAIQAAIKRNPATNASLFEFIGEVILKKDPPGLDSSQIAERRNFIMKFQQLTSPVMAKGMEDTAFYRYYPLASLNEVGGHPEKFGVSKEEFHHHNLERFEKWPQSLLSTTTHDTKRSEDVRARINVLSEIPTAWYRAIRRWSSFNKDKKTIIDGMPVPSFNEEYLFYQTLVGTWPLKRLGKPEIKAYIHRIHAYMIKALKEAKEHTSWVNANQDYEKALEKFVFTVLTPGPKNRFYKDLLNSITPVARAGLLNSLSQVVLKITSPGVPDIYQGNEFLNFSLVDPDNRRPVDYSHLRKSLNYLSSQPPRQIKKMLHHLLRQPVNGRIKLFVTHKALSFRRKNASLFLNGQYIPLAVGGPGKKHICAYIRHDGKKTALIVAARFFMVLTRGDMRKSWGEELKDTYLVIPPKFSNIKFRDVFVNEMVPTKKKKKSHVLLVSPILSHLPVTILESID